MSGVKFTPTLSMRVGLRCKFCGKFAIISEFLKCVQSADNSSLRDFALALAKQSRGNPYFKKLWNLLFFRNAF